MSLLGQIAPGGISRLDRPGTSDNHQVPLLFLELFGRWCLIADPTATLALELFAPKKFSLDLARNPPLNSKNALFARVGIEKVFALRAQGGGRVGYLEPKLHRVATLVKT